MDGRPIIYLLALAALTLGAQHRKVHRLAGGHLRIINPDPDDSELMKTDASGSREKKQKSDNEEKKTLSQQVADGKYGLIQNELFSKPSKRPGVLSYDDNPEVPKDNKSNFGGLNKNEIWLAENHLLVIRGGIYPPHEEKDKNAGPLWGPIDNFQAPLHQVKIPAHPKVPPPFPVQFTEDGPLQILGTNSSRTLNDTDPSTAYAIPPPDGFQPDADPYFPFNYPDSANFTPWQAPLPIPVKPSGEYPGGMPIPPFLLNGTLPPYFASLPPGAVILPPPGNQSDLYDEDDPSIYYPPPYSFFYPKDNSSAVPPGPLVPGIILPPPPNFFAPLEETTTTLAPQTKATKSYRQRKPTTTETKTQIHPTTTPVPPTEITTKKSLKVYPVHDPYYTNEVKPTVTTKQPKIITVLPVRVKNRTRLRTSKPQGQRRKPQVTVLRPVKPNTPPPIATHENEISDKPFALYGLPKTGKLRETTPTTQKPIKYYPTSNDIETNSITQTPVKVRVISEQPKSTVRPVQYYFYEEEPNTVTTKQPPVKENSYFNLPEEYYLPPKPTPPVRQRNPQYIYVSARPYNTQKPKFRYLQQPAKTDTFSIHIARLQNQISQYYTTPRPTYRPVQPPKPVYQFSFQAANYQSQHDRFKPSQPDLNQEDQFRPLPKYSVQIQQAIEIIPTEPTRYQPTPVYYQQNYQGTTERPGNYYTTARPNYPYEDRVAQKSRYPQNVVTPTPILEYSFEVTPNPVYQGFYTKPDEGYFDDNTKKYFTVFGKKLPSSTSPIPNIEHTTSKPDPQPQYQKPISLETDTIVNFVHPRPPINPDAELVPVNRPKPTTDYPKVIRYSARPAQYVEQKQPLREDNPEIIKAVPIELPVNEGQDGSFISYQLPGDDGAHFYFLTPQLAQRRDQGAGYYYSQPNSRKRRNENTDKER